MSVFGVSGVSRLLVGYSVRRLRGCLGSSGYLESLADFFRRITTKLRPPAAPAVAAQSSQHTSNVLCSVDYLPPDSLQTVADLRSSDGDSDFITNISLK